MELKTHNWETFKRQISRYIWFSIFFWTIISLSIVYDNSVGAIVIFFLLWGYFYYSTLSYKIIKIKADENWLTINQKEISRLNISGYLLEINKENWEIKNIVFLINKKACIYTISDSIENLKIFIEKIDNFVPNLESYEQTSREKLSRKLKL